MMDPRTHDGRPMPERQAAPASWCPSGATVPGRAEVTPGSDLLSIRRPGQRLGLG